MGRGDGMGYRIIYGPEPPKKCSKNGTVRARVLTAVSFLIFAWFLRLLWPEGREVLANYIIPGEPTLTQSAFMGLQDNLRHGMGIGDSLTEFCREILYEIL